MKTKRKPRKRMCKQWPNCACILRGTVEDCLPRFPERGTVLGTLIALEAHRKKASEE